VAHEGGLIEQLLPPNIVPPLAAQTVATPSALAVAPSPATRPGLYQYCDKICTVLYSGPYCFVFADAVCDASSRFIGVVVCPIFAGAVCGAVSEGFCLQYVKRFVAVQGSDNNLAPEIPQAVALKANTAWTENVLKPSVQRGTRSARRANAEGSAPTQRTNFAAQPAARQIGPVV
jgi:hypothetical protein